MEQRRILTFAAASVMIIMGWNIFVVRPLLPPEEAEPAAQAEADAKPKGDPQEVVAPKEPAVEKEPPGDAVVEADDPEKPVDPNADLNDGGPADEPAPAAEAEIVEIGSLDPDSGFFTSVRINTLGAAVESIVLNDPRYRELDDRDAPLKVVGSPPTVDQLRPALFGAKAGITGVAIAASAPDEERGDRIAYALASGSYVLVEFDHDVTEAERERVEGRLADLLKTRPRTLEVAVTRVEGDAETELDFEQRVWAVETDTRDGIVHAATFSLRSTDGSLELRKRFWLEPVEADRDEARRTSAAGYTLKMDVTLENVGAESATAFYTLQGPVGVPLEDSSRKTRDVKAAFDDEGSIVTTTHSAASVVSEVEGNDVTQWTEPVDYIGIDVLYFASLVMPKDEEDRYVDHSEPVLVAEGESDKLADISVAIVSRNLTLEAGQIVTHHYDLFSGPKQREILASIDAESVIDYGWFPFGRSLTRFISNGLLSVLMFLHSIGLPYGLAIIGLTVLVRGAMFPISFKQHRNMAKMKELQPKIKELQTKYANDREKMGQAMMALYREHDYNPVAGCLPLFLQLPIFIGLYQALGNAVDLRMAPFLWADNLAAPDALFDLPFTVPFFGWTTFNVLPIITIGLFVVQQQMFMPPPADEQQAAQMKMMKFMMIFMGVLFYNVPAGLCVYFIASSVWGIAERKMLEGFGGNSKKNDGPTTDGDSRTVVTTGKRTDSKSRSDEKADPEKESFLGRLLKQADEAGSQTAGTGSQRSQRGKGGGRNKGKRKKSRGKTRRDDSRDDRPGADGALDGESR